MADADEKVAWTGPVLRSCSVNGNELSLTFDDDPAGKFYKLEFWKLVWEDLQLMVWPTPKKVAQTFVISQTAFVTVVVLVLLIDALAETTVRAPPPAPPRAPAPELTARAAARSRACLDRSHLSSASYRRRSAG